MADLQMIDTKELAKCPHCEKDLDKIEKSTKGTWERHIIYRCFYCKKLLSIGNDLGFGN